ncbi:uncharacterized protein LOC128246240 [Mya arenaria]|uniref:uncharacterized protein LOC128246240 n=1 Tax=Mya arenaria TaxID=6604 RepID=UPI0022E51DB9|nr:uncharacterized protein LOC128246240 [Mya arenaria]
MTKSKSTKRKDRNSSGNSSENVNKSKVSKQRGPSEDLNQSVSDILSQANAVLYAENSDADKNGDSSVFVSEETEGEVVGGAAKMAEGGRQPTNKDLMDCMKAMNSKLSEMEKKLGTIEVLERKVTDFEKELRKVWVALEDRAKRTDERVMRLEDRVESVDMGTGLLSSRVAALEKQREELRDDLTYMKSQSMRNNLVFTNITEDNSNGNEAVDVTERKLRKHLQDALKIAKETVESIRFERVHRTPGQPIAGKVRNIVAKFTFFQERELVRREWKHLKGTQFHMFEQFPKEVTNKRRGLVKKMKEFREKGKKAWLVYDTLYVDGRPMRD